MGTKRKKISYADKVAARMDPTDPIVPMEERQPVSPASENTTVKTNAFTGADLFSFFTAEIIKEKKVFTR